MLPDQSTEMSDELVAAILISLPATIGAIGALIVSIRGNRKLEQVAKNVDGMTTALVEKTALVSHAEGKKEAEDLSDAEKAAYNAGKLAGLKDVQKEIRSVDTTADNIATKVVDEVVDKVITEKDDTLKKKPD